VSGTHDNDLGWGLRVSDGRPVHVKDVQNGRECGCLCPVCKSPLIARQGKRRIWHFAHAADVDCCMGGETALHLAAKQTLKDLKGRILLPEEVILKAGWPRPVPQASKTRTRLNDLMTHMVPARLAAESVVRLEPQDWARQGFRPDAVLEKDDSQLLIEIRVTHEVDAEKRRQMRKAQLGAIEIDLSDTDRNIAPDDLKRLVVSEAPRKWLVTGRPGTRKKIEAELTKNLETEACRLNRMIPRALLTRGLRVNDCPRRRESGFEEVTIYTCMDCEYYCGESLDDLRDTPLWTMLDSRIRDGNEQFSVLCAHRGTAPNLPTEKQKDYVRDLASDDLSRESGLTASLPEDWNQNRSFCQEFIAAHPDCIGCGRKMALRRNAKERLFWGCSDYPMCRGISRYVAVPVLDRIVKSHEDKRKIDEKRSTLARPEPGPNSLSQRTAAFASRSTED